MQRIAIYPDSFDPIHAGHLAFMHAAITACQLDKVYLFTDLRPRWQQGVKHSEHRTAMAGLAIDDDPRIGIIVHEHNQFDLGLTWPRLQERFTGADLMLLLPEDDMRRLSHWPRVDGLATHVSVLVGRSTMSESAVNTAVSVAAVTQHVAMRVQSFAAPQPSSTTNAVRAALRAGQVPSAIDHRVLRYIQRERLYASWASA